MKIVVLAGSPQKHGSSNLLAEQFIKGATEAGNSVSVVDAARANVRPCTGCVRCGYGGPCAQKDDMGSENGAMRGIKAEILGADMIVFVTPLYYYGMSAQLKTVVDRFCAFNGEIQQKRMKSALISAAWNADSWTFEALTAHYKTLVRYLNFQDMGTILGRGCGTPAMTSHSSYMAQAYELGRSLRG